MKKCLGPYFEFVKAKGISKSDRLQLAANQVGNLARDEFCFTKSGLFSTSNSIFVVLPWIMSGPVTRSTSENRTKQSRLLGAAFHSYKWFSELVGKSYSKTLDCDTAQEFFIFASFRGLKKLIDQTTNLNVFREEEVSIPHVRGKWRIEADLLTGTTPLAFTCFVDECDKNHAIFSFALSYCKKIEALVNSRNLRHEICDTIKTLECITEEATDFSGSLEAAVRLASSDKRFFDWFEWLNFIKRNLVEVESSILSNLELQHFVFNTPLFFEESMQKIFKIMKLNFVSQKPGKILGGASWEGVYDVPDADETGGGSLSTRYSSRPDYAILRENKKTLLLECKYKNYTISTKRIKGKEYPIVGSFQTSDRNQLLSFILSQSQQFHFETRSIVVVFPIIEENDLNRRCAKMCFNAKFEIGSHAGVSWNGQKEHGDNITIHFYGIKILSILFDSENGHIEELRKFQDFLNSLD